MMPIRNDHPLKHLFTGLVEHAFFTEMGICDPALADYLADLLVRSVHVDEMRIARDTAGRPVADVAEFLSHWDLPDEMTALERDRFVHRCMGDYTLFWTGVYPEGVRRTAGPTWRDLMIDYVTFGKRSYAIASELTDPDENPPPTLLRRLSEEFESCVAGLGIVRHELHQSEGDGGGELVY